jgi:hypothetical protein
MLADEFGCANGQAAQFGEMYQKLDRKMPVLVVALEKDHLENFRYCATYLHRTLVPKYEARILDRRPLAWAPGHIVVGDEYHYGATTAGFSYFNEQFPWHPVSEGLAQKWAMQLRQLL